MSQDQVTTLVGYLDSISHCSIEGWAQDSAKDEPVELLIFNNEHLLSRIKADAYRADLDVAITGSAGRLAFKFEVQLSPLEPHKISVVYAESGAHLLGSPKILDVCRTLNAPMMDMIATLFDSDAEDGSFERRLAFVEDLKIKLLVRRERLRRRQQLLSQPWTSSKILENDARLSDPTSRNHDDAGEVISLMTSTVPVVSIIIPVFSHASRLASCLRSIARCDKGTLRYEIIVVLNELASNEQADLAAATTGLIIIGSDINLGLAGACNRGKAAASGEFLLILHDDTEVEPCWLDELVRCALDHPNAGAVMSKIVFPDGRLQHVGRLLSRDGGTYTPWMDTPPAADSIVTASYIDSCSSSSLLVRREAWEAIGGLDENFYPAYFVDVDICLALQFSHYSILCEPRSVVRHLQSASSSNHQRDFCLWRNRSLLREKWSLSLQNHDDYTPDNHSLFVQRAQTRCEALYALLVPKRAITEKPFNAEAQKLRLQAISLRFMKEYNHFLIDLQSSG